MKMLIARPLRLKRICASLDVKLIVMEYNDFVQGNYDMGLTGEYLRLDLSSL